MARDLSTEGGVHYVPVEEALVAKVMATRVGRHRAPHQRDGALANAHSHHPAVAQGSVGSVYTPLKDRPLDLAALGTDPEEWAWVPKQASGGGGGGGCGGGGEGLRGAWPGWGRCQQPQGGSAAAAEADGRAPCNNTLLPLLRLPPAGHCRHAGGRGQPDAHGAPAAAAQRAAEPEQGARGAWGVGQGLAAGAVLTGSGIWSSLLAHSSDYIQLKSAPARPCFLLRRCGGTARPRSWRRRGAGTRRSCGTCTRCTASARRECACACAGRPRVRSGRVGGGPKKKCCVRAYARARGHACTPTRTQPARWMRTRARCAIHNPGTRPWWATRGWLTGSSGS